MTKNIFEFKTCKIIRNRLTGGFHIGGHVHINAQVEPYLFQISSNHSFIHIKFGKWKTFTKHTFSGRNSHIVRLLNFSSFFKSEWGRFSPKQKSNNTFNTLRDDEQSLNV